MKLVSYADLADLAEGLLANAGFDPGKVESVARLLVTTDMLGRRTHGLAMLPMYLADAAKGGMNKTGEPQVLRETASLAVWDGEYLPGLWLTERALLWGLARLKEAGVVTIVIRKSHHIGSLATLVREAALRGAVAMLMSSEPAGKRAAPYGGKRALFTPNPMALGYPGEPNPVLIDLSSTITTTSMTRTKHAAGEPFEHAWLLDADGRPTHDPAVLEHTEPRGSLQVLGGLEYGHKGFGLAIMVEALTQGLAGHGRLDAPTRWGGNVFLQLMDPQAFAGGAAFLAQTGFFAEACRSNPPIDAKNPVRMPGDASANNFARAAKEGIALSEATVNKLRDWAEKLNVQHPF